MRIILKRKKKHEETPKNPVLEYYKQTLENLDKTIKDLTEWIYGGNKNEWTKTDNISYNIRIP